MCKINFFIFYINFVQLESLYKFLNSFILELKTNSKTNNKLKHLKKIIKRQYFKSLVKLHASRVPRIGLPLSSWSTTGAAGGTCFYIYFWRGLCCSFYTVKMDMDKEPPKLGTYSLVVSFTHPTTASQSISPESIHIEELGA